MRIVALSREKTEQILSLYKRCEDYFLLTSGETPKSCKELFEDLPPDTEPEAKEIFGLFEEDGQKLFGVVDFVRGFPNPRTAIIGLLLIDPKYRGRGVGREVVDRLAEKAIAEGMDHLRVAVIESNEAGLRFWQHQGFVEVMRSEPRSYGKKTHRVIALVKGLKN